VVDRADVEVSRVLPAASIAGFRFRPAVACLRLRRPGVGYRDQLQALAGHRKQPGDEVQAR
jgi:hypothetical protein